MTGKGGGMEESGSMERMGQGSEKEGDGRENTY